MSAERERRDALAIFSVLWAAGAIFHLAKWSLWAESPASLALTVAAFVVLARPGRVLPLAGLFLAQVWALAHELPLATNHLFLSGTIGALGLLAIAVGWLRGRGGVDPARLYGDFAPPARVVLLLVFLFAGLAKLNADWFRPAVSCGALIHRGLVRHLPLLADAAWLEWTALVGAVAIELAIPILLLSRRLRLAGLVVAMVFLFVVGIAGFFNFAAITAALLFLFAPANTGPLARAACARRPACATVRSLTRSAGWSRLVRMGVAILAGTAIVVTLAAPWAGHAPEPLLVRGIGGSRPLLSRLFEAAWWLLAPALVAALLLACRAGAPRWPSARVLLAHPAPILAVVPLATLLNGLAPYAGWKTEASFAMFSNLRTETAPNHWLVPPPLRRFGLRPDLATIESSSDPQLAALAARGERLPLSELRAYVRERSRATGPDFRLAYVVDGRSRTVERAGRDRDLTAVPPVPSRWLVAFRPVTPRGPNPCRH